ncbi:MAG: TlpA family protein disulfide reductase, partial [Chitinophagales bacterium]|nr:TlpA family protein disulfide reductase [Chitinophagales bacterium]
MQKIILLAVLLLAFGGTAIRAQDKPITVVKLEELQKIYNAQNDTTYVVNFFATWCGPCMMEMPVLNNFYKAHKNTNIQLIFVSLDNAGAYKKLPAKMKKLGVEAPVYL